MCGFNFDVDTLWSLVKLSAILPTGPSHVADDMMVWRCAGGFQKSHWYHRQNPCPAYGLLHQVPTWSNQRDFTRWALIWSSKRPGVATMICTPFFLAHGFDHCMPHHPQVAHCKKSFMAEPYLRMLSCTWLASSRVGVKNQRLHDFWLLATTFATCGFSAAFFFGL